MSLGLIGIAFHAPHGHGPTRPDDRSHRVADGDDGNGGGPSAGSGDGSIDTTGISISAPEGMQPEPEAVEPEPEAVQPEAMEPDKEPNDPATGAFVPSNQEEVTHTDMEEEEGGGQLRRGRRQRKRRIR